MTKNELFKIIDYIVREGKQIILEYTQRNNFPVDYVHIFAQDEKEEKELISTMKTLGKVVEKPKTGITFQLKQPHPTESGILFLVNIRFPDPIRPQRGAPDFRVDNFEELKKEVLNQDNINLITRPGYEMIEIWDNTKDVLVYFPSEPLTAALKISTH